MSASDCKALVRIDFEVTNTLQGIDKFASMESNNDSIHVDSIIIKLYLAMTNTNFRAMITCGEKGNGKEQRIAKGGFAL
jgi:hypothetical protein